MYTVLCCKVSNFMYTVLCCKVSRPKAKLPVDRLW